MSRLYMRALHVTFVNRVGSKEDVMPVVEAGDVGDLFSERRAHEFPLDTEDLHRSLLQM